MIVVVQSAGEQQGASIAPEKLAVGAAIPPDAIWIDLVQPTIDEDRKVQDFASDANQRYPL